MATPARSEAAAAERLRSTVLDQVVEMHRTYLLTLTRHAKRRLFEREHQAHHRARRGLATVVQAMRSLMAEPAKRTMQNVYEDLGEDIVRGAVAACAQLETIGDRGFYDEIRAGHHLLKRYLPAFLLLPFRAQAGSEKLLSAIDLARALHRGDRATLGADAPLDFAKAPWRRAIQAENDKQPNVSLWEFALAMAVRDALQSGDLYLEESRHHVSFWKLVQGAETWTENRDRAYVELALPTNADDALTRLRDELDAAAKTLDAGLDDNPFARLAASFDRLAKALQALGRILKTTHVLRYLHDAKLRRRVQLQLNRGESRHDLARRLFFANRGVFRSGDYAEIMNKVSALSVLSNAVLVWNTVRIGAIVGELAATGHAVRPEDLARVSPLLDTHVIATWLVPLRPRDPCPRGRAEAGKPSA